MNNTYQGKKGQITEADMNFLKEKVKKIIDTMTPATVAEIEVSIGTEVLHDQKDGYVAGGIRSLSLDVKFVTSQQGE